MFTEMKIVHIPPPGKSGKILANIVELQFHPAKAPSDFSVYKEEGFQIQLSTTSVRDHESRLGKLSCVTTLHPGQCHTARGQSPELHPKSMLSTQAAPLRLDIQACQKLIGSIKFRAMH